ncbi:MAG TPA: iron-sulfur cluster assembly protein, partial [Chloroflexota bacterium]
QPLADSIGGPFFVTMGVSGFVEVVGLGLFAYNLWRTIDSPVDESLPRDTSAEPISGGTIVADALAMHPGVLEVLVSHGFTQLRSPIGRRTLAKAVTVDEACKMKGVPLESVLTDLRALVRPPRPQDAGVPAAEAGDPQAISPYLVTLALRGCYDPEIAVNIVDLGLVRSVEVSGGSVRVEMTLTAPGCPMGDSIVDEVQATLKQLPGARDVTVDLVFDPPWTPDAMSDEARRLLGIQIA